MVRFRQAVEDAHCISAYLIRRCVATFTNLGNDADVPLLHLPTIGQAEFTVSNQLQYLKSWLRAVRRTAAFLHGFSERLFWAQPANNMILA